MPLRRRSVHIRYLFTDFVLDTDRRELTRLGTAVAVSPKVFDLLLHLVQNRTQVVSRDELIDAVWNGRIISESTLGSHINWARTAIGDSGKDQRLIRTAARRGFRFIGEVMEDQPADPTTNFDSPSSAAETPEDGSWTISDKPSVAVLPLLNLSGQPDQDYFIDGIAEDIISELSRCRWLFVIARNSSFTYKGRSVDARQVSRDLGVRYVLEGSVRKSAERVRITGQLIDATTGMHVWAERFDGVLEDIFALQDQFAASVVGAVAPHLERAEIERARQKPTNSLNAYDFYLRGLALVHRGSRESIDEALALFCRSIRLDPDFASAHAMAAWCYVWRKVNGWAVDRSTEAAEGIALARRAAELGRDDAVALTRSGHALAHLAGDIDVGVMLIDRALELNPNLASAWFLGAYLRMWQGDPEAAIAYFNRAMTLSPIDPELYRMQAGVAMAHLFARRFDLACSWAEKAYANLPSFVMTVGILSAANALAGRIEKSEKAMKELRTLCPGLCVREISEWLPIRRQQDLCLLAEGLSKAGLPYDRLAGLPGGS